jgi:WD40 repeat protein
MFKLISSLLVTISILAIVTIFDDTDRIESETNPLDALVIDFYPLPEGQLPLKKIMKHRIKVTNSGTSSLYMEFRTEVIAPYPMVIETVTPEPSFLWLEPGESEYIYTKMDEKWGEIPAFLPWETNEIGSHERTYRWTFTDKDTNASKTWDITIPYTIVETKRHVMEQPGDRSISKDTPLRGDGVSGPITFGGIVVNEIGEPLSGMEVVLSSGNWDTTISQTGDDGRFSFQNLPDRDDWVIFAQTPSFGLTSLMSDSASYEDTRRARALSFAKESSQQITLTLVSPKAKADYRLLNYNEPDVGYWRGDVDDAGTKILLINGMENWSSDYPQQETKSLVSLFTMDGELAWSYKMGWEGWGVSLSNDGNYAAFTTSNCSGKANRPVPDGACGKFGVLDASDGSEVWTKAAEEVTETTHPKLGSKEVQISNTNKYLAVGATEGTFLLYDLMTGELIWSVFIRGQVRGILFDESDKYIYAGSGDGYTYKLSASDGSVIWKTYNGSWPYLGAFKFSKQGDLLGVGGKYGDLAIIDTETGELVLFKDMDDIVSWLDFSPDGKHLVAGGGGQYALTLFDIYTGEKIWHVPFFSHSGMFTKDGKYILAGETLLDLSGREIGNFALSTTGCRPGCDGLFTYISDDMTRVIVTRRDMDPGGIGIYFWEGQVTSYSPGIVESADGSMGFDLDKPKPKLGDPELGDPDFDGLDRKLGDPELGDPDFDGLDRKLGDPELGDPDFDGPKLDREEEALSQNNSRSPFGTDDPKILECLETTLGPERFKDLSIGGGAPPDQREREAMGFCYQPLDDMPTPEPRLKPEPTPPATTEPEIQPTVVPTATSMPVPTSADTAASPNPTAVSSEPSSQELSSGGCMAPNNGAGQVNAAWILLGLVMPGLAVHSRLRKNKKIDRTKFTDKPIDNNGDKLN